jgi:TonB family protein
MMAEDWTKWESLIVNGTFPLLRFLGKSNHSVVFLTEASGSAKAAIKLIPADPLQTEARLSAWRAVAALSHPHLIRIFDVGQCELGGYPFLFVVMEYAEQSLAQILPHRALTTDEAREMLLPTLDALAFLHRNNLVHRGLKPPNFLVVNDQLKLASDTVCPAGKSALGVANTSIYDPPEANNGSNSAAGDVWSLGVVITEALTQSPPTWPDERSEIVSLPATLPPAFVGIVRRCLSRNPDSRPTLSDLEWQIKPVPQTKPIPPPPPVPVPQPVAPVAPVAPVVPVVPVMPVAPDAADQDTATQKTLERHRFLPAVALAVIVLVAAWAALHLFRSHPNSQQPAARAAAMASQPVAPPAAASQDPGTTVREQPAPAAPELPASVLHEEIPNVSRSARESIHGHIKVTVRVTVNRSGEVVDEAVKDPGSSRYFTRQATEAARKWTFAPADDQGSREWLLQFEFTRDGTTARVINR